ncbi:MAG: aspartate carbamoyltransferase [Candidatus Methylomirabilales bacterium]
MKFRHVVEAQQFNKKLIRELFDLADRMEATAAQGSRLLTGKILASLFYTPSTRTRLSFEAAMLRLGGQVISTENAAVYSSESEGGSLEDLIRSVGAFADVLILRHPETGSARRAAAVAPVPLINAGDGTGQHPTQALLDLYTIHRRLGGIDGVAIAIVGDLANSRTARSLCYFLAKYTGVRVTLYSPTLLTMKEDILAYLHTHEVAVTECTDQDRPLAEVASHVDVMYQTHVSKQHFGNRLTDYERAKTACTITPGIVSRMRKRGVIMHPFPRVDEIHPGVDSDPRAAYFDQIRHGVQVRMALLASLLAAQESLEG